METAITEVTHEEQPAPGVASKQSKRARRTLTDETEDPSVRAFADLVRLGHEAFEAGRADDARTLFESVIALGHSDPFAFTMLGTIELGAGRHDQALGAFESALAIDPDDLVALVYRGEIRLARRKTSAAIEDLERAVKLGRSQDPFVGRARKLLAMAKPPRTA
ncbi:MAG: tetratricopeptide repeat protein [Myxococcaceae bacterium]